MKFVYVSATYGVPPHRRVPNNAFDVSGSRIYWRPVRRSLADRLILKAPRAFKYSTFKENNRAFTSNDSASGWILLDAYAFFRADIHLGGNPPLLSALLRARTDGPLDNVAVQHTSGSQGAATGAAVMHSSWRLLAGMVSELCYVVFEDEATYRGEVVPSCRLSHLRGVACSD